MGYKLVGCYPCVQCSHNVILNISQQDPEHLEYIADLEKKINSTFFGPNKIPAKAYKGDFPVMKDIVHYVRWQNATGSLFDDDNTATSCMSFYGLCE